MAFLKRGAVALLFVLACLSAGVAGAITTYPNISGWYAFLNKPDFSPPNWVFAPVWTALYAMMGISAYLIYEKGIEDRKVRDALSAFMAQLAVNVFWSVAFFGFRSPLAGFIAIIVLLSLLAITMIRFYGISKGAGLLLAPYFIWVSFASLLNLFILVLNQ